MTVVRTPKAMRKFSISIVWLITCLQQSLFAQETGAEESDEPQSRQPIEQIIVTIPRTLFRMRAQIEFAQERLYSAYNDANANDEYDVECRKSNWTHTHIQEQQCWPKFFDRLLAENAQEFFYTGADPVPVGQMETLYQNEFAALRANILRVAQENPQVMQALMELGVLEQTYKEKREQCMQQEPVLLLFRKCD